MAICQRLVPKGITLQPEGSLEGVPPEPGEFRVVVRVTDGSVPAQQRNQELILKIMAPLFIEWGRYPVISGAKARRSVKISNSTEEDFDLTFVVVAVNENGRATALGYQRFTLQKGRSPWRFPSGRTCLPELSRERRRGGRSGGDETIHRARLVTADNLTLQPQL